MIGEIFTNNEFDAKHASNITAGKVTITAVSLLKTAGE